MPAGWYDDGSGNQRWWDGERWSEQVAPGQGASVGAQAPSAPLAKATPVLGFVGLALAVLGTILACIPATFLVGVFVLIAGFVVSLIGLFRKGAAKWPSIVGMILSVVGGAIGTVVVLVVLALNVVGPTTSPAPIDTPSSSSSEAPSDEPTDAPSATRPSPEEIAVGFAALAVEDGVTSYEDVPEFYPCMGQQLFDSEISDESLQLIADGQDVEGPERDALGQVIIDAAEICDPNGEGVNG